MSPQLSHVNDVTSMLPSQQMATLPSSQVLNGHNKCHVHTSVQFDNADKGSTREVVDSVILKADIGDGARDPVEVDGEKLKDHCQQDSVDIFVIKSDLSTGERFVGTRRQTQHPRNPNNLLIPGLFHTQIALYSVMQT